MYKSLQKNQVLSTTIWLEIHSSNHFLIHIDFFSFFWGFSYIFTFTWIRIIHIFTDISVILEFNQKYFLKTTEKWFTYKLKWWSVQFLDITSGYSILVREQTFMVTEKVISKTTAILNRTGKRRRPPDSDRRPLG